MRRELYYGDCLDVLRTFTEGFVDLVYLDPPFNSNREYNAFFAPPDAEGSRAQMTAFEDSWHWNEKAQTEYDALATGPSASIGELMQSLHDFLGDSDMLAYLVMMASRLVEMHRVMKDTATLYLHCDPTASHYIKIVLDGIFGPQNFRNELVWLRTAPKSNVTKKFPSTHDVILRYTKSDEFTFKMPYLPYTREYIDTNYRLVDENGRHYQLDNLLNPNKNRPNLTYEFMGITRTWRWEKERMERALAEGRIVQTKAGNVPRFKRYLDEMPGVPVTDVWHNIRPLQGVQRESLGYPTQKPVALLSRIIQSSSNEGDLVLDPFCGCGTAVHAAERLKREWIGVDITHLSIALISRRLKSAFPGIQFNVTGTPKDEDSARYLAESNGLEGRYQFQFWALSVVDAMPYQGTKKGADSGIDGFIWAYDSPAPRARPFRIIVSVKSGAIPPNHIRELAGILARRDRTNTQIAVLLTLEPPTKPQAIEAVAAGKYRYPNGKEFPRIQIITVKDLFNGVRPAYIDYGDGRGMGPQALEERREPRAVQRRLVEG